MTTRQARYGGFGVVTINGTDDSTTFASYLKELRIAAGFSQEEIAARAGISDRTVRDIERGRVRFPRPETARLLGAALSLSGASLIHFINLSRAGYWTSRGMEFTRGQQPADRSPPGIRRAAVPAR